MAAVVLGVMLGGLFAARFAMPTPIDRTLWHVVSPGLDERIQDPALGRGVYVEDGALTLRQHAFHRAEILSPKDTRAVGRVQVAVAEGSVRLNWPGPTGVSFAVLGPDTAMNAFSATDVYYRPDGQPWTAEVAGSNVVLHTTNGPITLGPATGGSIELTAVSEEVRVRSVSATDTDGNAFLTEDYAHRTSPLFHWLAGGVAGLLFGVPLLVATRRRPGAVGWVETALLVLPPLAVCAVPAGDWLYLVERAYLVRTPAWGLARLAVGLSCLPVVGLAALRSGLLVPPDVRAPVDGRMVWVGLAVFATLAGAVRGGPTLLTGVGAVATLAFLLMPLRIVRAAEQPPLGAALVDAPAHIAVVMFGLGGGLLGAVAWRFLTLLAAAGQGLLRTAPRPVTDQLFVMLLLLPVSLELAVRDTYLDEGWDLARLSGDLAPSVGWQDPQPFWTGTCPGTPTHHTLRILWMGGSSTGGAYQFRDQPTAFFPAQTHHRLCALVPPGTTLVSENYGDGGRDTFTISRSVDDIARRSHTTLVVVYTGVNDLLTQSGTQTRAQRESEQATRDAASTGLASIGARSRLLTGIGLFLRPLHATEGPRVPEVPLADAEDNFHRIAQVADTHGAQVLLLTEVIRTDVSDPLAPYTALEAQLAAKLPTVHHLDLRDALATQGPWDDQTMLVDQNHLSRAGSARVAAALTAPVARILGLDAPETVDLEPVPAAAFRSTKGGIP